MNHKRLLALTVLSAAALLGGCFGGGGDNASTPPVTEQVPATVSMSVAAFIDYLTSLVTVSDDTLEAIDVSNIVPATDDTAPPSPVN